MIHLPPTRRLPVRDTPMKPPITPDRNSDRVFQGRRMISSIVIVCVHRSKALEFRNRKSSPPEEKFQRRTPKENVFRSETTSSFGRESTSLEAQLRVSGEYTMFVYANLEPAYPFKEFVRGQGSQKETSALTGGSECRIRKKISSEVFDQEKMGSPTQRSNQRRK